MNIKLIYVHIKIIWHLTVLSARICNVTAKTLMGTF